MQTADNNQKASNRWQSWVSIPTIKLSPAYEKQEYEPEVPTNLMNSKVGVETNENAGEYQLQLFDKKVFNFPKPCSLIKYLFGFLDNGEDMIVLDFFSGSGTAAEAVMHINQEHGDNRYKYILVQVQEDLDEALKATQSKSQKEITQNAIDFLDSKGLPHVLTEIGKERIRRAGKKIKEESPLTTQGLDTGFRVLKLDSTNMEDVYYSPQDLSQADLFGQVDNVKPGRSSEDLLFQVMLELGVFLDSKIVTETIDGKTVYNVADGFLIACFDTGVTDSVITAIAKQQPQYAVLRDSSYADDSTATNFEQIFKTYSPNTTIKTL